MRGSRERASRIAAILAKHPKKRERTREGSEPVMIAESCLGVGEESLLLVSVKK